ncbi:MAG: PH domain-containing protein [Deltaproteobacteria bacterium]|nr:PH domain-containing protein [Deltaproteobacteria bacterium]
MNAVIRTYPSKKDAWIVSLIVLAGVFLFSNALFHVYKDGVGHLVTWVIMATFFFYAAVILIVAYPVYYDITPSHLVIRSGLALRYFLPLASIASVRPSRSPLSAPAWSLDRLRIDYKKNGRMSFALISPRSKFDFLYELAAMVPDFEVRGDGIIRISSLGNE